METTTTDRAPIMVPVYQRFSALLMQRENCMKSNNQEWLDKSTDNLLMLVEDAMPSGSGIDTGTKIDLNRSTPERLVFDTAYHHMDENGFYCGWTYHTVTVRPSLFNRIDLSISGRNSRNDIKSYLWDVFYTALTEKVGY